MNYDNDLKLVDLTDLKGAFPVAVRETIQVLSTTEEWERSIWGNGDSLGYPTVVRNDRGLNPDGRYYLYYARPCGRLAQRPDRLMRQRRHHGDRGRNFHQLERWNPGVERFLYLLGERDGYGRRAAEQHHGQRNLQ